MSSDDGWEEAFENDTDIKIDTKKLISKQDKIIQMVRTILKILKDIFEPFTAPIISETIDYNIKRVLQDIFIDKDDLVNYENNIKLFKSLKHYGIFSRIYFVMDSKLSTFIEFCINEKIIQNDKKWSGCVFFIDSFFNFDDYSWHFSRKNKHYEIFKSVIQIFKSLKSQQQTIEPFVNLDNIRLKILPTSTSKFAKHPFYVLQSQLKYNLAVFPKRPIFGYFKGEPVFSRENIIRLRTESQYYKLGKEIKSNKPYKIHNGTKLYNDFQVKDIELEDMGEKRTADYFHENHIPKKCVFIDNEYAEIVCRKLNIEYRTCFRGFNRGCPIYSGVFIYKTDLLIFSNFLREYSENINTVLKNEIGLKSADTWRKIFKTVTKYLEIRQMLGLEDVQDDES